MIDRQTFVEGCWSWNPKKPYKTLIKIPNESSLPAKMMYSVKEFNGPQNMFDALISHFASAFSRDEILVEEPNTAINTIYLDDMAFFLKKKRATSDEITELKALSVFDGNVLPFVLKTSAPLLISQFFLQFHLFNYQMPFQGYMDKNFCETWYQEWYNLISIITDILLCSRPCHLS